MNVVEETKNLTFSMDLPETMLAVTQTFDAPQVEDVRAAAQKALEESGMLARINAGDSVAVGSGSRGIHAIDQITKAVVDRLLAHGAQPFVTPLMGSHGGATVEGQVGMLAGFGITEETMGVPIRATMDVQEIGRVSNGPTLCQDTVSAAADHTILVNRVKPHTSFRSHIESGLAKMAVIGMGKQHGAATMHAPGVTALKEHLAPAARVYESNTNLLGGIAIVENAYDMTAEIAGLTAAEIGAEREAALLERAKSLMASLPFPMIEVLVVRQLGKNISGTGMDTNVLGRLRIPREDDEKFGGPDICSVAFLDLTEETHGNANGMGLANVTTARVASQVDYHATYMNALTSGIMGMLKAHLPIVMPNDQQAIQLALRGAATPLHDARIVMIPNTLQLDKLWVSTNLRTDIDAHPRLTFDDECPLAFDEQGMMTSPWQMEP
ncbi:MAG: DUF2088 domain-containing protein [Chloroflexota bacterium]